MEMLVANINIFERWLLALVELLSHVTYFKMKWADFRGYLTNVSTAYYRLPDGGNFWRQRKFGSTSLLTGIIWCESCDYKDSRSNSRTWSVETTQKRSATRCLSLFLNLVTCCRSDTSPKTRWWQWARKLHPASGCSKVPDLPYQKLRNTLFLARILTTLSNPSIKNESHGTITQLMLANNAQMYDWLSNKTALNNLCNDS